MLTELKGQCAPSMGCAAALPVDGTSTRGETPAGPEPYHVTLADEDVAITWQKLVAFVLFVCLAVQGYVCFDRWKRPPIHIDSVDVASLPVERLQNVTPDLLNATGMAREAAERMLRLNPTTVADDQAFILNRMVPELATVYEKQVPQIIQLTRKARGEVRVAVKAVTPVQGHLPFKIEVLVVEEFLGDYKPPGKGKADPANPKKEEYRVAFTLCRTAKTSINRDALLIKDVSMATTR